MTETVVTVEESGQGLYTQTIKAAGHPLTADETTDLGGLGQGPSPYALLLSALGACTSITLRMYAAQKKWDLKHVALRLTHKKEGDAENKKIDIITLKLTLEGGLDETQRQRLLEIAGRCPVHRTLTETTRPVITSSLSE
jgi:putative redox protein